MSITTDQTAQKGSNRCLQNAWFILLCALFILLSGNQTCFGKVLKVYPFNGSNALFLLSLFAVCACSLTFITAIFSLLIPLRASSRLPRQRGRLLVAFASVALAEQTDVPVILWLGQSSSVNLDSVLGEQHMAFSHDAGGQKHAPAHLSSL